MKIAELLMNIKNKEFKLERGLEVKKYLPIETKKTIAQAIIYDCSSTEQGITKIDSVERYMSYVRYMITTHTNLDYTDENYDALCSTEYNGTTLLNAIMKCFESDATECSRILNLVTDDFMQEHSIENSIGKFLYEIGNAINNFADSIDSKFSDISIQDVIPKDFDIDKISTFVNKYIK